MFGIDDMLMLGGMNLIGGMLTNDTNQNINSANNAFNEQQAQIGREFNAGQAELARSYNSAEAEKTRQFNANQEAINRDYQLTLSNTAWQRGVKDMQAAGLNPMLAYMRGGASTPTGGAATGPSASHSGTTGPTATSASPIAMKNPMADAIATAMEVSRTTAQTAQMQAQTELTRAQRNTEGQRYYEVGARTEQARSATGLNEANARLAFNSAQRTEADTKLIQQNTANALEQFSLIRQQIKTETARTALTVAEEQLTEAKEQYTRGEISIQKYVERLKESENYLSRSLWQGAVQEEKFQSVWGQLQRVYRMLNPLQGLIK